jgi:hypothetical protein
MNTPSDHRGNDLNGPHKSTPRLQQVVARQIQRDRNLDMTSSSALAANVIKAHRQGAPVSYGGKIETGPVTTGLNRYIGNKEYNDVMSRLSNSPYDDGRDDAFSATVENRNYPYEVNSAVRDAGGTSGFIGKAVKNRKGYADEDEF